MQQIRLEKLAWKEKGFFFSFFVVETLLILDYLTTTQILALGGVELNPIVNAIGLGVISLLKVFGGFVVGLLSYIGKSNKVMFLMTVVFGCVVCWNFSQILLTV